MFGLFGKKKVEANLRQGVEVGEMRMHALATVAQLASSEGRMHGFQQVGPDLAEFTYGELRVQVPLVANLNGLSLRTTLPECTLRRATSATEKATAYRCLDHVCRSRPGARAYFDPASGDLVVAVESAGFGEQLRADTAIDIALFMLEEAVYAARMFLGLPATPVAPARAEQFGGGYHFGEGMRTYPTARDAFAAYLVKHLSCEEVSRDERSVLLRSGPVDYEVMGMGWPSGFMVATTTRGFRHSVRDDARYVQIQERLAQPVTNPERPGEWSWNFRDPGRTAIAYFQEDGSFVVGQYGFGSPRTDANGPAYELVAQAQSLGVYAMTLLVEDLPDDLYSGSVGPDPACPRTARPVLRGAEMTKTRAKPAKKSAPKPAADADASADKAAPPKSTELKVRRPHAPARAQPGDPLGAALEAQGFTVQDEPGLGRRFAFEGGTYYLVSAEGDETFYHLLYPNFWELESDEEYVRALYACDAVNREAKLVKLHTAENDVWAGVESLHETPAAFAAQVPRYLSYLQESVRAFRDVMLAAAEDLAEAGA